MKLKINSHTKKVGLAVVLTGTITACTLVAPKILGSYFNEDVKKNSHNVMVMLTKTKKDKKKVLSKNERSTMKI